MTDIDAVMTARLEERLEIHISRLSEIIASVNHMTHQVAVLDQRVLTNEVETAKFREAKHNINRFLHIYEFQYDKIDKSLQSIIETTDKRGDSLLGHIVVLQEKVTELQNWKYTMLGSCATLGGVFGVLSTLITSYIF